MSMIRKNEIDYLSQNQESFNQRLSKKSSPIQNRSQSKSQSPAKSQSPTPNRKRDDVSHAEFGSSSTYQIGE